MSSPLSSRELRDVFTPEVVRQFQVLQLGLLAGVGFFAVFVIARQWIGDLALREPTVESLRFLRLLSLVNAVFFVVAFVAGGVLFRQRVAAVRAAHVGGEAVVETLRGAWILRLALLEASALLGLAAVFLATGNGVLSAEPAYWANLLTAAAFLVFGALTFPTQDRLVETVRPGSA